MKKMERELFSQNFVNEKNIFCNKIEFGSLHLIKLANVLCQNEYEAETYIEKFHSRIQPFVSLMEFRDLIKQKTDRGVYITAESLDRAISNNDESHLASLLEDLFLEPIKPEGLIRFIKKNEDRGFTTEHIIRWARMGRLFVSMYTFNVQYVENKLAEFHAIAETKEEIAITVEIDDDEMWKQGYNATYYYLS